MTTDQKDPAPPTPFLTKTGRAILYTGVIIPAGRVLLRPISERDTWQVFENFTDEVTRYMVPQPSDRVEDTVQFIRRSLAAMERGENLQLVIVDKASAEFLGGCGLHVKGAPRTPELGIWLKAAAHGSGYGKEAVTALVQWAEQNLLYDYLIYPVDRDNIPSRKIPEALGGEIFEETICSRQDGENLNILIYRIYPPHEKRKVLI